MVLLLEGDLARVSLFNLLQFVKMEQKTCALEIDITEISQQARMVFDAGLIRSAHVNLLSGADAMYRIIAWWTFGHFSLKEIPKDEVGEAQINRPIESILLEAARRMDESQIIKQIAPKISSSLSFSPEAVAAMRDGSPVNVPEFARGLPRSFSVARFFDVCPLSDQEATAVLMLLLQEKILAGEKGNQAESQAERGSVYDSFSLIVMEFVGVDRAKEIVTQSLTQAGFDATVEGLGFSQLLAIADVIGERIEAELGNEKSQELMYRLRARITSMI